jgi:UDP-glucose 4-epimerase
MKVFITGSEGFVGNHLTTYLKGLGGFSIDSTSRSSLDIVDPKAKEIGAGDAIVHLASKTSITYSFRYPYDTYLTNIVGTLNLLELARARDINKFIYASTYVYGQPEYLPVDEKHPLKPHSPYTKSKLLAEKLCEYYYETYGINVIILRPFYLYGPNAKPDSLIPSVLHQIRHAHGRVVLSSRNVKRDFLFITDFVNLISRILEKEANGCDIYNVGSGSSYSLEYIVTKIAEILNVGPVALTYNAEIRPRDVTDMVADISKVSSEFKWKPEVEVQRGLKLTVDRHVDLDMD